MKHKTKHSFNKQTRSTFTTRSGGLSPKDAWGAVMNTNSAPLSATEDAEELSIEEAAGLVVKTVALQGFVEGAQLAFATGAHDAVDNANLVLDGNGEDLQGARACRPLFGVGIKDGEYAFVIHPRVYTFDELCEHGFLSVADVLVLTHAAKRVVRQSNRMQLRLLRERQARAQGLDLADPKVARWIKQSRSMADAASDVLVDGAMPRAAREMMGTALTKGVR